MPLRGARPDANARRRVRHGREDVAGFIRSFAGSHHFVLDHLVDEVLQRQPEPVQIAKGLTNQEIAARLYLSLHTVKSHAHTIYAKLGVAGRTQAVAKGRALGYLSEDRRPDG